MPNHDLQLVIMHEDSHSMHIQDNKPIIYTILQYKFCFHTAMTVKMAEPKKKYSVTWKYTTHFLHLQSNICTYYRVVVVTQSK